MDHDHRVLEIRGWLCQNCNHALGLLQDSPKVMKRAIDYLEGGTLAEYPVSSNRRAEWRRHLLEISGGVCEICLDAESRFVLDHCWKQNRIRGVLCYGCNIALGKVRDSPDILRTAIRYLRRFENDLVFNWGFDESEVRYD